MNIHKNKHREQRKIMNPISIQQNLERKNNVTHSIIPSLNAQYAFSITPCHSS